MGFIKVGVVLFASLLVGMANASNGNKNNNNKTENKMTVTELTQEDFVKKVYDFETNPNAWKFEGDKPAVIDFYATWCGPCKMVAPIIEELAAEFEVQVIIGKCDVDENGDMAAEYGIRNIPTVLFFKNGEIVDKQVGAVAKPVFAEKVKKLL